MKDKRTGRLVKRQRGQAFVFMGARVPSEMREGFQQIARMGGISEGAAFRLAALRGAQQLMNEIEVGEAFSCEWWPEFSPD